MSDTTTTTAPPTSDNTGTATTNQGPGTGTALEAALNKYLSDQLASAATNGSYGDIPVPSASTPQVTVVQAPSAASGDSRLPLILGIGGAVIGIVSGVAYLLDRSSKRRGGK